MPKVVDLDQLLQESGAILKGHFLLSSGLHSDIYVEKFRVLECPEILSVFCSKIADSFRSFEVEFIAGPSTGGMIIAYELSRLLGVQARYIESENGSKTFRRNASIPQGAKVLVVDDVLTTGLSLTESAGAVRNAGGNVIGYGVLIDRSENFTADTPVFAAVKVQGSTYKETDLPAWLSEIPITKPGTRNL